MRKQLTMEEKIEQKMYCFGGGGGGGGGGGAAGGGAAVVDVAVAVATAVAVAEDSPSVVVTVAVAVAVAVAVSSADTGAAWNIGAEHINNATARIGIVFLRFILPPYLYFVF